MKKLITIILSAALLSASVPASAAAVSKSFANETNAPEVLARSAILYDVEYGILYAKNEYARMYPASLTKIVTSLVFLDYFRMGDYITCGPEVNAAPVGSSTSGNFEGETLSFENALRALIIPSGNETACVVAAACAKKALGDKTIGYSQSERWFAERMNEKAKELGALDTNFVNPHGFHDARHYTTAYDMALITTEALKNKDIARIAAEVQFTGNGAGVNPDSHWQTKDYTWKTHNDLIVPSSQYYYPYATGMKTGFHDEAGDCVAATAEKGGRTLVAIVLFSPVPGRWLDATTLFEYGFNNYSLHQIQGGDVDLGEMEMSNPRLGESGIIEYMTTGGTEILMTESQFSRIEREIVISPELIAPAVIDEATGKKDPTLRLISPIEEGQTIGETIYRLDGNVLFRSAITTKNGSPERTFNSDVDYYVALWKARLTSPYAMPVYALVLILLFIIIRLAAGGRKRNSYGGYGGRRY